MKVDLSTYDNSFYRTGANVVVRTLWYFINAIFFRSPYFPLSSIKVFFLRLFGATVGAGVTIKPGVNIKYPWFLKIHDHVWIGENVWIDCLTNVEIGSNACISQGALLLTGNHDRGKRSFDLIVGKVVLEEGAWIGAKAVVCPGVTCGSHCMLTVSSVAVHDLEPYGIYQGNPAKKIKVREIA